MQAINIFMQKCSRGGWEVSSEGLCLPLCSDAGSWSREAEQELTELQSSVLCELRR